MSHETHAFRGDPRLIISTQTMEEAHLAYLRRSAFDPHNAGIYVALNVTEEDGELSGSGGVVEFTSNQIETAIEKIGNYKIIRLAFTKKQKLALDRQNSMIAAFEKEHGPFDFVSDPEELMRMPVDYSRELEFLRRCALGEHVWIYFH